MADSYLSTIWYRVAGLQPRLRSHVKVHRHRYRGLPWYVLHDHSSGRIHRFTPAAYLMVGQFDGTRTVDEVWRQLAETREAEAPSQDDVIRLLSNLHQNDLIQYRGSPDIADLLERQQRQAGQILRQNLTNPMTFRIPLWDPDAFLTRTLPFVRPLTGWFGLALWLAVVTAGLVTMLMHWSALAGGVADQLLTASNLMITLITYPLLKALHELAHGYLARARGGEVREMGIMFLVFFPVPYVDASSSAAFRNKWQRAAVAAGGIFVETFVAAAAMIVWAGAEPGLVRAVAFNLVMVGGLSTLIVNGNPLLKFDGYYVLSDLIEIPNLATRANRFWGYLVQRYLFGAQQLREEIATPGERVWFLLYAPAAYVYRLIVMVGIAIYVAQSFFLLGVGLAIWSVFNAVIKPAATGIRHVVTSPQLRKVRRRANGITFGAIGVVIGAALLIPLPLRTDTEGVIWLPDEAHLRARTTGFVTEVLAERGAPVAALDVVARLEDPTLSARLEVLRWRVEEARRRVTLAEARDRRQLDVARLVADEAEAELARETARIAMLSVRSPVAGRFEPVMPEGEMVARQLREGDLVGYVLPDRPDLVRAFVTQDDIALLRDGVTRVQLRQAGHMETTHEAEILRIVPQATGSLPAAALGQPAGGRLLVDPTDPEGLRLLEPVFVIDISLPPTVTDAPFGSRVTIRFSHGREPAADQIYRRLRQLFLRQFNA
jgi:putative peptide zinc metalloprotease protein